MQKYYCEIYYWECGRVGHEFFAEDDTTAYEYMLKIDENLSTVGRDLYKYEGDDLVEVRP